VWGIDREYLCENVVFDRCEDAVKGVDVVILPTPPSEDEVRVSCPLFSQESGIKIHKLFEMLSENTLVLGGRMSPRLREMASKYKLKSFDYFNREELLIKNSVPTAEGAIGIAIDKMPKTIFGANIAVIGFGRIGEILSQKLKALGAEVTVYARKSFSIAKAHCEGVRGKKIEYVNKRNTLFEITEGYDIVFNTVPYWVVTEEILENMPSDTLLVDLASPPGGFDIVAAKKYGIDIIRALSLPAKTRKTHSPPFPHKRRPHYSQAPRQANLSLSRRPNKNVEKPRS
jgi:dipicolinate synthase subunit A